MVSEAEPDLGTTVLTLATPRVTHGPAALTPWSRGRMLALKLRSRPSDSKSAF